MNTEAYRVSYINQMDGRRHVLIGKVGRETADAVASKFGDKRDTLHYMGEGVRVDLDDGTPDGAAIAKATAA